MWKLFTVCQGRVGRGCFIRTSSMFPMLASDWLETLVHAPISVNTMPGCPKAKRSLAQITVRLSSSNLSGVRSWRPN